MSLSTPDQKTPNRTRYYLLGQFLAITIALFMTWRENWTCREVAWGIWISSLCSSIFIVLGSLVRVFANASPLSATARAEGLSQRRTTATTGLQMAAPLRVLTNFLTGIPTLFAIIFLHTIVGLLLSVAAPMNPENLFGRNGFINADTQAVLGFLALKYWPLILGTCLSKVWIFLESGRTVLAGRFTFGGIGALIAFLISSTFLLPLASHLYPQYEKVALGLLVFLAYAPWGLISRDSQEKKQDRIANRDIAASLPISRVEGTSIFIVGFLMLFSLFFMSLPARGLYLIWSGGDSIAVNAILSIVLVGFVAVGVGIFCLSLSLRRAKQELYIDQSHVRVKNQEVAPPFRLKRVEFQEPLSAYRGIGSKEEHHPNRKGASSREYSLFLVHSTDPSRNVVLYEAYFEDSLRGRAKEISALLRLPILEGLVAATPILEESRYTQSSPVEIRDPGAPPGKKISVERTLRGVQIKYKRLEKIHVSIYLGAIAPLFVLGIPWALQWSIWTTLNSAFMILFAISAMAGLVCGYIAFTQESLFISEEGIRAQLAILGRPAVSLFFPRTEIEDVSISKDGFALRISLRDTQKQIGRGLTTEELEWLKNYILSSLPISEASSQTSYR